MNTTVHGELPRILIVDDNQEVHEDFRRIFAPKRKAEDLSELFDRVLGTRGPSSAAQPEYDIEFAFQGEEALECMQRAARQGRPFAAAFVDVRMPPGIDGVQTAERMWQIQTDLQVVICSAYSDYAWPDLTRRFGHTDALLILKKPFEAIEVRQIACALTRKWLIARNNSSHLALIQALLENSSAHCVVVDNELRIRFVNASFGEKTGRSRTGLDSQVLSEEILPQPFLELLEEARARREVVERMVTIMSHGEEHYYLSRAFPVATGSEYTALTATDITMSRRMEQRLHHLLRLEDVGRMTSRVAHDFINFLNAIHGSLQLAEMELDEEYPRVKGYLANAQKASKAAVTLCRQLLAYGREQKVVFRQLSISALIRDFLPVIVPAVGMSIECALELMPDTPDVLADAGQLQQVLMNLCVNGRDAMSQGGTLTLRCFPWRDRDGEASDYGRRLWVAIEVRDTGTGMTDEVRERLFEPYFTTKSAHGGTGLGLSSVYAIVTNMGGRVEVESRVGEGTTMRVLLPALSESASAEALGDPGPR